MDSLIHREEQEEGNSKLSRQALSFLMHTILALVSWLLFMLLGYLVNPVGVPQFIILLLSALVPLTVGYLISRKRQDDMAPVIWLLGLIWILIVSLWILDMPTGPNECFQCDATEKLSRTFFSIPKPSGLIDNDGPFLGTWPAAALMGYALGAWLALRKHKPQED